jgi:hypothetical protein
MACRAPPLALEKSRRRESRDANAVDDIVGGRCGEIAARRYGHDSAVRTHAPRERECLSTLPTLILWMKDLGDQADPRRLHRLSVATATTAVGLAYWSAAPVPASGLRREVNFRNVQGCRCATLPARATHAKQEVQRADAVLAVDVAISGMSYSHFALRRR